MEHIIFNEIPLIRGKTMKRHGKVDGYKYVQLVSFDGEMTYRAEIPKFGLCEMFRNARDAAIKVDKTLLTKGKEAVNILKRKK